jgi:molecular chaperone HscB
MPDMTDHFERLGLPRRFDLDPAEVERRYLLLSRQLHPDFHGLSSDLEQRASLELSSLLNEAWTTLKDPVRRAEYLAELEGAPSASELRDTPPDFLMEMLDLRMQIAEPAPESERQALEADLTARREGLLAQIGRCFGDLEADRTKHLRDIRLHLNSIRYLQGLLRDLREAV